MPFFGHFFAYSFVVIRTIVYVVHISSWLAWLFGFPFVNNPKSDDKCHVKCAVPRISKSDFREKNAHSLYSFMVFGRVLRVIRESDLFKTKIWQVFSRKKFYKSTSLCVVLGRTRTRRSQRADIFFVFPSPPKKIVRFFSYSFVVIRTSKNAVHIANVHWSPNKKRCFREKSAIFCILLYCVLIAFTDYSGIS